MSGISLRINFDFFAIDGDAVIASSDIFIKSTLSCIVFLIDCQYFRIGKIIYGYDIYPFHVVYLSEYKPSYSTKTVDRYSLHLKKYFVN